MVRWKGRPKEFRAAQVAALAGYRGAQRPHRVEQAGRRQDVTAVLQQWREPDFEYFRVRLADGTEALLRHTLDADDWSMAIDGC